ncbi:MAG: PAS domain-containing protein, partial [Chloroflexota bacterium]
PQPGGLCRVLRAADGTPLDLEVIDVSEAGAAVARMPAEALIGRRLLGLDGSDGLGPELIAIAGAVAASGEAQRFEVPIPDGRAFGGTVSRVGDDLVLLLASDVTDQRQAELARHTAEERYQRAMAAVKDGVLVRDATGRLVGANEVASELLGIPIEELTSSAYSDDQLHATDELGRPIALEQLPSMVTLATGQPTRDRLMTVQRRDGRRIWILATAEPLHDPDGAVSGAVMSFTDVTEQIATGAELQDIQGRYQTTLQEIRSRDAALRRQAIELDTARRVAGLGFWRTDLATAVTIWSPELFAMGGFPSTPDGVVPKEVLQVAFNPDAKGERDRMVAHAIETGTSWEQELCFRHVDGSDRWALVSGGIERDPDGRPIAALGTVMDITRRKLDELRLRASEEALRRRTEELEESRRFAGIGTWRLVATDDSATWSRELFDIVRMDPDGPPLRPSEINGYTDPEVVAERERLIAESLMTGVPFEQEYELRVPWMDEPPWWWVRGVAELDEQGIPFAVNGIAMDITQRKRAELALRASQEQLQQRTADLEEARRIARIGTWRMDLVTTVCTWSDELHDTFGRSSDDLPAGVEGLLEVFGPDGLTTLQAAIYESAATGEPWDLELAVHRPDGQVRWILNRGIAETPGGTLVGAHGTSMDITERKEAELALQASEERFRRLLDDLAEGAEILDPEWRIRYINRGFVVDRPHYDPADDIGRSLLDILPGFERTEAFRRFQRAMEERVPDRFEGSFTPPGESTQWWDLSVQPVPEGIFVLGRNSTARHHAEQVMRERDRLLQERTAHLEEAGRIARLGTWHHEVESGTTTWSPEMYEVFGFDPAQGIPAPGRMEALLSTEALAVRDHIIRSSLAAGVPYELEFEIARPDGERRWIHARGAGKRNADGTLVAMSGTSQDITERKQAEADLRRFSDALEQRVAERTAELEAANEELRSFSYTVSHDLRSPVRAVAGFSRILERDLGATLDENARHKLHNIRTAGEAMGKLIDDLLAYTRVGRSAVRHEPVPVGAIARRLAATFAARVEERGGAIEVVEPLATPLGDPTLVEELLINLVDNALNYARGDVPPRVRIAATCEGSRVRVSVGDNGVGIPPQMLDRIFEVFTRLESEGEHKGTGIGLAIVRKAARSMGTDVTVDSTVGVGTTFSVLLPCAEEAGEHAGQHGISGPAASP